MTFVACLELILKNAVHLQRSLMLSNSTRFRCGSLISLYSTIRKKNSPTPELTITNREMIHSPLLPQTGHPLPGADKGLFVHLHCQQKTSAR